jgi:hypothetical protein
MASTQITVENRSPIPINVKLTWADGFIGQVDIEAAQTPEGGGGPRTGHQRPPSGTSGNIPCEYVWYDLRIYTLEAGRGWREAPNALAKSRSLVEKQARGGSSWIFDGTAEQGYRLDGR